VKARKIAQQVTKSSAFYTTQRQHNRQLAPWIRYWFRRNHPTSCCLKVNVNTILLGAPSLLQPIPSRHNYPTKLCWSDRLRAGRSRSVAANTSHFLCTGRRDPLWGPPSLSHAIFKNNYKTIFLSLSFSLYCTQLLACPITVFSAFTHSGYYIFHLLYH